MFKTLTEFRKEHPSAGGNLCFNCTHDCSDHECHKCSYVGFCENFEYADPDKVKNPEAAKILREFVREYSNACQQASEYVNKMVKDHHWW